MIEGEALEWRAGVARYRSHVVWLNRERRGELEEARRAAAAGTYGGRAVLVRVWGTKGVSMYGRGREDLDHSLCLMITLSFPFFSVAF